MLFQRLFTCALGVMLTAICSAANAQSAAPHRQIADSVFINGKVLDDTQTEMIGAIVELIANSRAVATTATDENGNFHLYHPRPVSANEFIRITYQSFKTQKIPLKSFRKPHIIQMELDPDLQFCPVVNVQYRVPLIDPWGPTQRSFTSEEIEKMAR